MKMKFYSLLLLLPVCAEAQTTIQHAMDYKVGTVVTYRKCNAMAAGSAGANQTWNFSSLTPLTSHDTLTVSYVGAGSVYAGADLLEKTSDSTYQYIKTGLLADSTVAVADSSVAGANLTVTFLGNNALLTSRPLVYNVPLADTFTCNLLFSGLTATGNGTRNFNVDGWGTLTLPNGVFSNVLRLRIVHSQTNSTSIPVPINVNTTVTTYMWFDALHKAPLLRMDSTSVSGSPNPPVTPTNKATAMYLLKETYPADVSNIANRMDFTAAFVNTQLILNGNFANGKEYETVVYDISGRKIFAGSFMAQGARQELHLEKELPANMYFVLVTEKSNASNFACIKVVKE